MIVLLSTYKYNKEIELSSPEQRVAEHAVSVSFPQSLQYVLLHTEEAEEVRKTIEQTWASLLSDYTDYMFIVGSIPVSLDTKKNTRQTHFASWWCQ